VKTNLQSSTAILLFSTVIMLAVTLTVAWTLWSVHHDIGERKNTVVDLAKTSAAVSQLEAMQEVSEARILSAHDTETRIRNALVQAGIRPTELQEVTVSEEQNAPGQPFKRRDIRIHLNLVTLTQFSIACTNLRTACPAAGFAEAELLAGPPVRQSEPERWNARLLLSEFRYSAQY